MIYETFVLTLLARMGLSLAKPDAGAVREEVDRLVRLSAMVDDLLAEAGYDTLFDTREKCLEALRQDIKAKLGTASVDRETLARNLLADEALRLRAQLADAQQQVGLWRDTAETQNKMRLDLAAEQDKLVAALDEAQNQLVAERKKWPELKAELATACAERAKEVVHNRELNAQVERTRALVRARGLTIALLEKIILGHADPGAVLRDAETGETAHISPDVRAALGRLSGLAAENRRLETLNAQIDIARDQHLRDLLAERRKNGDVEQMARTNFDLRKELGDLQADDRERRFTIANKLLGMHRTSAPAWDELLVKLEECLKELTDMALARVPEYVALIAAKKPLDSDRVRLALLDFSPTVNFINDLADHLVKRLA